MQNWRAGFLAICFAFFCTSAHAQDPAKIFDFLQNQIQNEAARQQQRQYERQQQQQNQILKNALEAAWSDCFKARILERCDEALQFDGLSNYDRHNLARQRADIITAIQAQQDQEQRERAEQIERDRQAQIEAANEQRRLQFERDQAAAQKRQQDIDARSALAQQARQAVEAEEKQAAELRGLASAFDACRRYEVEGCDQVIASRYSSRPEFAPIVGWRATALTFRADMSACQTGTIEACDRAFTSPAAYTTDRNAIAELRTAASPVNRALATLQSIPSMIGDPPLLLRIFVGGATVIGLALAMMMFRSKGDAARPAAFATATRAATPPPLPADPPISVTNDRPRNTETALDSIELSNADSGEPHDNTRALPDPTPLPMQNALVPVSTTDIALADRDTPTALRALRLAHAYLDEACKDDLSIVDGQRAARTTLSLASRQLEIAFRADPNARLELDDNRLFTQAHLRALVLCQEALTWRLDKLGRACALAERACQADPTDPASFQILGSFHFDNRNRAKAIDALTRSYELDPDNIETCKLLDRAQKMGDAEIVTYKATRAGVGVANTGIGIYNTGVKAWNIFAMTYNVVTFPIRLPMKIIFYLTGGRR